MMGGRRRRSEQGRGVRRAEEDDGEEENVMQGPSGGGAGRPLDYTPPAVHRTPYVETLKGEAQACRVVFARRVWGWP
jgi:hypothetical protein